MESFHEHSYELSRLARGESSADVARAKDDFQATSPANYVPTRAELVGGVVGGSETDATHLRLQRMAAFESHDYDPIDNDLEEDALRGRTREDYKREQSVEVGDERDDRRGDGNRGVRDRWIGG